MNAEATETVDTSESAQPTEATEAVDTVSENVDSAAATPDAPPDPSYEQRLKRVRQAQQNLAQFFAETSADYARSCVQKWRAHGVKFAVELPASVVGIVAVNPQAAADSLRAAGFVVVELTMPFAEQALAAAWSRIWWRRHYGQIPRVEYGTWMVWPGAELPVDAEGQVVLAGEAN